MRNLIILILSLISLEGFSKYEYDQWTLFPYAEFNFQKHFQTNLGLRYRYLKDCPGCPAPGAELQLGTDLSTAKNNNFNIRFEASVYFIFLAGISTQYWNTSQGPVWTLGPKTGINLYFGELNYSYNFQLSNKTPEIGRNRIGLKIDIETVTHFLNLIIKDSRKKSS